jgi:hypothetical protein
VRLTLAGGFSDCNTWAQLVTNMMNSYKNGDPSPSASGPITSFVQLSGACTGSYTPDKTSNWYMQLDSKGWHFDFYRLDTAGPNVADYNHFDAVTVDTQSVSGSVTQADIAQDMYLSGATVCISSSSTAACLTSLPLIATLGTTSVPAGSSGFTLTINESNFVSGAVANWTENGQTTPLSTQLVNSTTVTAQVPANPLTTTGTAQVTVVSGGQTSTPVTFTIPGSTSGSTPTVSTKLITNTNGIVNDHVSCRLPSPALLQNRRQLGFTSAIAA